MISINMSKSMLSYTDITLRFQRWNVKINAVKQSQTYGLFKMYRIQKTINILSLLFDCKKNICTDNHAMINRLTYNFVA